MGIYAPYLTFFKCLSLKSDKNQLNDEKPLVKRVQSGENVVPSDWMASIMTTKSQRSPDQPNLSMKCLVGGCGCWLSGVVIAVG